MNPGGWRPELDRAWLVLMGVVALGGLYAAEATGKGYLLCVALPLLLLLIVRLWLDNRAQRGGEQ